MEVMHGGMVVMVSPHMAGNGGGGAGAGWPSNTGWYGGYWRWLGYRVSVLGHVGMKSYLPTVIQPHLIIVELGVASLDVATIGS